MRKAPWKPVAVAASLLGGMALKVFYTPGGLQAYLVPTLYWCMVAGLVILVEGGIENTRALRCETQGITIMIIDDGIEDNKIGLIETPLPFVTPGSVDFY